MPVMELGQINTELFSFEMLSEEEVLVYSVKPLTVWMMTYFLNVVYYFTIFFPQLCLEIPYGYWKKW